MSEPDSSPKKNDSKAAVFARRLASTVVLLSVVFYGLLSGGTLSVVLVGALVMLLNVIGLLEFYGMVKENQLPRFKWLGLTGGVVLLGAVFLYLSGLAAKWFGLGAPTLGGAAELEIAILAVFLIAILVRRVFAHPAPPSFSMNGTTILGVLYVSWLLGFIL
ncbi:MAG: hypothetical protein CMO65_06535, partial [Verrucomicrobiales bacterium]|nr:hypothetical protein [Verrucomicrobiales bacterium]